MHEAQIVYFQWWMMIQNETGQLIWIATEVTWMKHWFFICIHLNLWILAVGGKSISSRQQVMKQTNKPPKNTLPWYCMSSWRDQAETMMINEEHLPLTVLSMYRERTGWMRRVWIEKIWKYSIIQEATWRRMLVSCMTVTIIIYFKLCKNNSDVVYVGLTKNDDNKDQWGWCT